MKTITDVPLPKTTYAEFTLAAPVRFANRTARFLQKLNIKPYDLTEAHIAEQVQRKTGLSDFGDPDFRQSAAFVIHAADTDGNLNFVGRWAYHEEFKRLYTNRLLTIDALKHQPDISHQPIQQPLFIVSFPRTGTTFLHRLLTQDPQVRFPAFWQLLHPRLATTPEKELQQLIHSTQSFLDLSFKLAPKWQQMTPIDARESEECIFMLTNNYGYFITSQSTRFRDWFLERDSTPDYLYYRQELQLLQWKQPERRWILKSPAHLWKLDAMFKVFPDAAIIQTHRHPQAMFGSWCSLIASMRKLHTDQVDLHRIGREWLEMMKIGFERAMAVRRADPSRFFDVSYNTLVSDPLGTVERIYAHFGYEFTPAAQGAVTRWLQDNPQHKYGVHRYSLAQFGITEADINRTFADYIDQFELDNGISS